jgi:myo-inositol-1-phosphate synthase
MTKEKIGVCVVGLSGAVSTTLVGGLALINKGLSKPYGILTEVGTFSPQQDGSDLINPQRESFSIKEWCQLVNLQNLIVRGWDIDDRDLYTCAKGHGVITPSQLELVEKNLAEIKPWRAAFVKEHVPNLQGTNVVEAKNYREMADLIMNDMDAFKKEYRLNKVIMANLGSTSRYTELRRVHGDLGSFEKGLETNHPDISPSMIYAYAALQMKAPFINFTPNMADDIPALVELANEQGVPVCGKDGKTGQTLMKSTIAPALKLRQLHIEGWFSTNILGNRDGLALDNPESRKAKIESKTNFLSQIMNYEIKNHLVFINYYPPRGDDKEAWDNIDIIGFLGEKMQIKINFLCKDSILAAPLIIDLIRFMEYAQRIGEKGKQYWLALYFKSPYFRAGQVPIYSLHEQEWLLLDYLLQHKSDA